MKKRLLSIGLIALLSMVNACASESNIQMVAPPVTEPANNTNPANQQANSSSFFQPERQITKIVSDIMNEYDHNKNNRIDYRATATEYNDYFRSNESNRYGKPTTPTVNGQPGRASISVYTKSKLFLAADKNTDGTIIPEELISFITENYDKNNDNILSSRGIAFWQDKDEYQFYYNDYRETYFKEIYL